MTHPLQVMEGMCADSRDTIVQNDARDLRSVIAPWDIAAAGVVRHGTRAADGQYAVAAE